MWRAIEAEMEREREQAEALALIERKKAEMRARAKPPSAGVMQNALATLEAPTEGKEYLDRFKPEISEIQEILVDEDVGQQEIDDSDVLLAPELVQVRQDEVSNYSKMLDELLETESSEDTDKEPDEESTISDLTETESIDTNSNELESEDQEEVDWDKPSDEEDGWAVGW